MAVRRRRDVSRGTDAHPRPAAVEGKDEFGDIDVALVGVPMDLGVTNRAGARLGPRAVRAVERIGPYEHALKIAPMGVLKVADIGDVPMASRFSLDQCIADIEAFFDSCAPRTSSRSRSAATIRSPIRS